MGENAGFARRLPILILAVSLLSALLVGVSSGANDKLALGILGIGALIALIPWPDVPAIPFPDVPTPDIPWPDVSLPDVTLPGWIEWIIETSDWWAPVLVAIVIAVREARRRRRRAENAEREDARPGAR